MKAFSMILTLATMFSVSAHAITIDINGESLIPGQVKTVQALRDATAACRKNLKNRPTAVCSAAESRKIAEVLRAMDDGKLDSSIVSQTYTKNTSYRIFFKSVEFKAVAHTLGSLAGAAAGFKAVGCQSDSRLKENALMCAISNYTDELTDLVTKQRN